MVQGKNIVRAVLYFLFGLFFITIGYQILDPLLSALLSLGMSTMINALIWTGFFIISILCVIVAPAYMIFSE